MSRWSHGLTEIKQKTLLGILLSKVFFDFLRNLYIIVYILFY
uniref:Uncharacterized protein n=1 Tax=Caudovirales sp. ctqI92 TaxID=2826785 RepID=A0A8S5MR07_9CAUD|nr:MAG TPA: hypothetical protein [Caudovirales sp. ctqI92]